MNTPLTPEDILNIAQSGEGYNAEFKVRVPSKVKELTEEICAFANAAGGMLLIGVDDDNNILGTTIDNFKRSAIQNSLNEINPHLSASFYSVDVHGKIVWVIEVNSGTQKPYALSGAIYVRQGPNTQKLTSVEQMRDFFQQSDRIYFDEAPCAGFTMDKDLDLDWFTEFRMEAGISRTIGPSQIIQNLRLLLPDGSMKNGGALFFGEQPERFIETAAIRCIAFEGTTKTSIIDDKLYGGALIRQYEQAMQWLKGKLDVRYEIDGGGPRKEHWEIPETAFKEAVINALSHRDYYDKGARITIELFEDRVEISNPGGLTSAISPNEFGTKSHSRNPLIFGLFVRIKLVEQVGSGIGRMQALLKEANLPAPDFKTDGMFTVVFHRGKEKSSGKTVEKTVEKSSREKIIELIKGNAAITTRELADLIGITDKGIEYQLSRMQKDGVLTREGSKKSGVWIVNKIDS